MKAYKLIPLFIGIIALISVAIALDADSSVINSTNGKYIQGTATETFNVTFNESISFGPCFFYFWNNNTGAYEQFVEAVTAGTTWCDRVHDVSSAITYPAGSLQWYVSVDGFMYPFVSNYSAIVDRTAPVVTATVVSNNGVTNACIDYTGFTCTDTNVYNCTLEYSTDAGVTYKAAVNNATAINPSGLGGTWVTPGDGSYTFRTKSYDKSERITITACGGGCPIVINAAPATPIGLLAAGNTDTSLKITWNPNAEPDVVNYRLYGKNGSAPIIPADLVATVVANGTLLYDYIHMGLTTGNIWFYQLTAWDGTTASIATAIVNATVQDFTPPVAPLFNPVNNSIGNASNATLIADYSAGAENIFLSILSGGSVVKNFTAAAQVFVWEPTFMVNNTVYEFVYRANDLFGNIRVSGYRYTTDSNNVSFNVSTTQHYSVAPAMIPSKSSVFPGDYILVNYSISTYWNSTVTNIFTRAKMSNMTSPSGTIGIYESLPKIFCDEDYSEATTDIIAVPTKNVYNVTNDYVLTQNALNCTDQNAGSLIEYNVYLKIPIPVGASPDSYSSTINLATYTAEI